MTVKDHCGVDGCEGVFLSGGLARHRSAMHREWVARQHALPDRDPRKHPIGKPGTNLRTADLPPLGAPITLMDDPALPSCTICQTPMHRHWRCAACTATGCYIMERSTTHPRLLHLVRVVGRYGTTRATTRKASGMKYERCPICHEWGWLHSHRCPPLWQCRLDDEPDEWSAVHAVDAEEAAKRFAEDRNNAYGGSDYQYQMDVVVRPNNDDTETTWQVSMELVPSYDARQRKQEV